MSLKNQLFKIEKPILLWFLWEMAPTGSYIQIQSLQLGALCYCGVTFTKLEPCCKEVGHWVKLIAGFHSLSGICSVTLDETSHLTSLPLCFRCPHGQYAFPKCKPKQNLPSLNCFLSRILTAVRKVTDTYTLSPFSSQVAWSRAEQLFGKVLWWVKNFL